MLAFEEVVPDVLLGRKPDGPPYHGWKGEALRVPPEEYEQRVEGTRKSMHQDHMDYLVVVQPEDVYYLTGFYTIGDAAPQALILPAEGKPFFVARLIECDLVPKLSWVSQVWTCPDSCDIREVFFYALAAANVVPVGRVGLQMQSISAAHFFHLQKFFQKFETHIVDASKTVERVRLVKSDFEQGCIRASSRISEAALQRTLEQIRPGLALAELHKAGYDALVTLGSEVPGYVPIIRKTDPSGHGSWMPGEECAAGELVFLELSGCTLGHHAPLMRTVYLLQPGQEPPSWLLEAEQLIQKTFEVCLPMMRPGAKAKDIDATGRAIMTSNSYGLSMSARLAYSTGSTSTQPAGHAGWGDADFSLVGHNDAELKAGMVFHFIPWFQKYDEPTGPIGISDTVIVTHEGGKRMGELPLSITLKTT